MKKPLLMAMLAIATLGFVSAQTCGTCANLFSNKKEATTRYLYFENYTMTKVEHISAWDITLKNDTGQVYFLVPVQQEDSTVKFLKGTTTNFSLDGNVLVLESYAIENYNYKARFLIKIELSKSDAKSFADFQKNVSTTRKG